MVGLKHGILYNSEEQIAKLLVIFFMILDTNLGGFLLNLCSLLLERQARREEKNSSKDQESRGRAEHDGGYWRGKDGG